MAASSACCTMKSESESPLSCAALSIRFFCSGRRRASVRSVRRATAMKHASREHALSNVRQITVHSCDHARSDRETCQMGQLRKAARRRLFGRSGKICAQLAAGGNSGRSCGLRRLAGEVVLVPEVLVERAGQLGGPGAEGGPAALEEKDRDQAALR